MEYRTMGNSGLKVSALGLGANNLGSRATDENSQRVLDTCMDLGINFIDTADVYSKGRSEELIGQSLKGKRQQVIVATKGGGGAGPLNKPGSRRHLVAAAEQSLRRLQTDFIDLYYLHMPDRGTPIEETLRALDDLVKSGKVRYLGASNYKAWQVADAHWTAKTLGLNGFICQQVHYNLLKRDVESETIPACEAHGIGLVPYYPLASGLLTGKYRRGQAPPEESRLVKYTDFYSKFDEQLLTDQNLEMVGRLEDFARERDHPIGDLAIAWLLANPVVGSVIAGATKPEQIVENVKGVNWKMTPDDLLALDKIIAPAGRSVRS